MSGNSYELLYLKSKKTKLAVINVPKNLGKSIVAIDQESNMREDGNASRALYMPTFGDNISKSDAGIGNLCNNISISFSDWHKVEELKKCLGVNSKPSQSVATKSIADVIRINGSVLENEKLSLVGQNITLISSIHPSIVSNIRILYLSRNYITSLNGVQHLSQLHTISLNNNFIQYLEEIRYLSSLKKLEKLSLDGNLINNSPYYRQYVINLCPSLLVLDNVKILSNEVILSKKIIRKATVLLDQLCIGELRMVILWQLSKLLYMHAELMEFVFGRFRWGCFI